MLKHTNIADDGIRAKIRRKEIRLGGNAKLKIYGTLDCKSGKRMKRMNRVFFMSDQQARENGYRPCGHCMKNEYLIWKNGSL
jgi:methylphosphotriester-DNA--protein-cysteine methyltransferase